MDVCETMEETTTLGRKEKRYSAHARVKLDTSEFILKDISLCGGRIQSEGFIDIVPNGKYTVAVIPEEEANIQDFEVEILSRWVRLNQNVSESGFIMVLPSGHNKFIEDYIEFLKTKYPREN